ncbi:MAG: hypothetical protein ACLFR1_15795 [Spirochaetia bacterium]
MGTYFDQLNETIQNHIQGLVKQAGLADTEESLELLSKGWLEKEETFEKQIEAMDMEEVDDFQKDEERGCLIMTYSGSLLTVGPVTDEGRKVEYASIGLRRDVPDTAEASDAELGEDIAVDSEAVFSKGPVKKSSPVLKIAVTKEELEVEEEEEKLSEVTQIIADDFIEVNKTIISG